MPLPLPSFSLPWLAAAAPLAGLACAWWAARGWGKTAALPVRAPVLPGFWTRRAPALKAAAAGLCTLFCLLGAAGPAFGEKVFVTEKKGVDVVVALDLSYSMLAADLTPDRLGAAKRVLGDFLAKMDGNRVGIVVFAGSALTLVPPTDDLDFARDAAASVTFETIDQCAGRLYGTNLDKALALAAKNLSDVERPGRGQAVVIVTDGGKEARLQSEATKSMLAAGIPVHAVGIGKGEGVTLDAMFPCTGGPFPQAERDVRLNVPLLSEAARNGGGKFLQATNDAELADALVRELSFLRAGSVEKLETRSQSAAWAALALAALSALALAGLSAKHPAFE